MITNLMIVSPISCWCATSPNFHWQWNTWPWSCSHNALVPPVKADWLLPLCHQQAKKLSCFRTSLQDSKPKRRFDRCNDDTQVCRFEKEHHAKCWPGLDLLRPIVLILPCVSTLSLLVQFLQNNGSILCTRQNCTHPDGSRANLRSTGSWILSI